MLPIQRKISAYNHYKGNTQKYIRIHDVGTVSTAKNNVDYFSGGNRGASAHYFVDDISIWQSVEDFNSSWDVGDGYNPNTEQWMSDITNYNGISIEMCLKAPLTVSDKTVTNTVELVQYLMKKYNIPASRVVRHYDASRKNCPGSMQANSWAKWNDFKKKLSQTTSGGGSNVAAQKPTSYVKGDKVVIAPTAKNPLTTPARHFSRAEFKTTWTVESRNGLTLVLKDNNSNGKLTVRDTDVVYMPTNDIGFMDTVKIKFGVNNWRGGKVMSQGAKNATYSVRIRDGRNLFIDDGWGNEGWVMDSQVERIK